MNRLLLGSLTLVFATALLGAQTPEKCEQEPDRVTRRAKEMREQLGKPKQVKSHVRVQVRLKNGNRLRGVVKDGRLVERVNGLRFVDAHAADEGAGIRIWYSGGTRNYVFVPFAELQNYHVLQRLTAKELADIEAELQMQEVKRDEQLQREQLERLKQAGQPPVPGGEVVPGGPIPGTPGQKPAGKEDDKDGKTEGDKKEEEASAQAQLRKWFKLVQDYPPNQGWNAARRDEIKRRFQVIGARPSAHEQRFVDEFAEWQKACNHFGVSEADGEDDKGGPPIPGRKRKK